MPRQVPQPRQPVRESPPSALTSSKPLPQIRPPLVLSCRRGAMAPRRQRGHNQRVPLVQPGAQPHEPEAKGGNNNGEAAQPGVVVCVWGGGLSVAGEVRVRARLFSLSGCLACHGSSPQYSQGRAQQGGKHSPPCITPYTHCALSRDSFLVRLSHRFTSEARKAKKIKRKVAFTI